jgi:quercetin dioxygenase-like cupin family protein
MLAFNLHAEMQRMLEKGVWTQEGRMSKLLVRRSNFRVMLFTMKANAFFAEHKTPARITVQSISGHIVVTAGGHSFDLPQGHMVALDSGVLHEVKALVESAFLLTMAWPAANENAETSSPQTT